MNITDTIRYITQQAEFNAKRALECNTEMSIMSYATRADIYFTVAAALCILMCGAPIPGSPDLGDAEDKARKL